MTSQQLEQEVAALRALNQQVELEANQALQLNNLTIQNIRATPGLRGTVDDHIHGFREQAPVLASAPTAPGLPAPQFVSQPGQLSAGYQYNSSQLYQVTGDGIRVSAGEQPDIGVGLTAASSFSQSAHVLAQEQELAEVRAQYAALIQQQQQAERQLEVQKQQHEQQLQGRLAQEKAAEILKYRQQMAGVANHLKGTQDALRQAQSQQHNPHTSHHYTNQHSSTVTVQPGQGGRSSVLVSGGQAEASLYEFLQGADGKQYKVLKSAAIPATPSPQELPATRLEYRCSPVSGSLYQVRVPLTPQATHTSPGSLHNQSSFVWQKDQKTGLLYQVPVST